MKNYTSDIWIWHPHCKQTHLHFCSRVFNYPRRIASLQNAALQSSWHNPDYLHVNGERRLLHHHEWFRYNCTDGALILLFRWEVTKWTERGWEQRVDWGSVLTSDFAVNHCCGHELMKMNGNEPFTAKQWWVLVFCVVSSLKDQSINLRVKAGFGPAVVVVNLIEIKIQNIIRLWQKEINEMRLKAPEKKVIRRWVKISLSNLSN